MNLLNVSILESRDLVPWHLEVPSQFEPLWIEKQINLDTVRFWVYEHRWTTGVYISLLYILLTWAAKQWMTFLPPLNLRGPLLLWNGFLAALSFTAVYRGVPEIVNVLSGPNGLHRSLCVRDGLNQPVAFWGFMFLFSKFLHFGDTLFLILRKRPITFLHWYHHAVTFWCIFYSFAEAEPITRWAAGLNYSVHFMMYSYYFVEGLNFKVPKFMKMFITGSEIAMFVIGLFINLYTVAVLWRGEPCARTWRSIALQMSVGFSFLLLFAFFFYKNYLLRSRKTKKL